jgi:hypothetical protein
MEPEVLSFFHKSASGPLLSSLSPVRVLYSRFSKIHFNDFLLFYKQSERERLIVSRPCIGPAK